MVINKRYEVKVNPANWKHYSNYFDNLKSGQVIYCSLDQLLKNSRVLVDVVCDVCSFSKSISFKDYNSYGFENYDWMCRGCKTKSNNLKKWGVENVFQSEKVKAKIRNTVIKKYGVKNISELADIKEKKKNTNQLKYGVNWPQQSQEIKSKTLETLRLDWNIDNISHVEEIKNKKKNTYRDKTGFDFIFCNPEFISSQINLNLSKYGSTYSLTAETIKRKIAETNIKKWGNEIASKNPSVKEKIKKSVTYTLNKKTFEAIENLISIDSLNRVFEINCITCSCNFEISWSLFYKRRETKTIICTNCNPVDKHQSGLELDLYNFIRQVYSGEIIQNIRIDNRELDIFLPQKMIAFEFNGLFWHSELFKHREYHHDKTEICNNQGITLFHIWEDDWLYRRSIVESVIKNKLGLTENKIYARKCQLSIMEDKKIVEQFLRENHIQGSTIFSTAVVLSFENQPVSVMTFVKRKNQWELNRFCSKTECHVVGAASRLLNYFCNNFSKDIYTFSDNSYSTGNLYKMIGFEVESYLKPDYYYFESGLRNHKFNYRKRDTKDLLKIWDAGKIKFKLKWLCKPF